MSLRMRKSTISCVTQTGLYNQKQARSMKFLIKEEEELYCPRSKDKDADQLNSYCRLLVLLRLI